MSHSVQTGGPPPGPGAEVYTTMQQDPDFQELKSRLRRFVFPLTGLFLAWYFIYVLLAAYAPGFMGIKLVGNINVGLVLGLLQFVSTFVITGLYVRYANSKLDPIASKLRHQIEGDAQ